MCYDPGTNTILPGTAKVVGNERRSEDGDGMRILHLRVGILRRTELVETKEEVMHVADSTPLRSRDRGPMQSDVFPSRIFVAN
jgi:hypothetical protein